MFVYIGGAKRATIIAVLIPGENIIRRDGALIALYLAGKDIATGFDY